MYSGFFHLTLFWDSSVLLQIAGFYLFSLLRGCTLSSHQSHFSFELHICLKQRLFLCVDLAPWGQQWNQRLSQCCSSPSFLRGWRCLFACHPSAPGLLSVEQGVSGAIPCSPCLLADPPTEVSAPQTKRLFAGAFRTITKSMVETMLEFWGAICPLPMFPPFWLKFPRIQQLFITIQDMKWSHFTGCT